MKKEYTNFNGHSLPVYYDDAGNRVKTIQTNLYGCKVGQDERGAVITLVMEPWVEYMDSMVTGVREDGSTIAYPIVPSKFRQEGQSDEDMECLTIESLQKNFGPLSEIATWGVCEIKL